MVLLGVIIFVLSKVPDTRGGYGRGHLARYMCQLVGTDPESPQCIAVSMGGWLLVVVTIGLVLKAGRDVLKAIGAGGKDA